MVIVAQSGTGKTTATRVLAERLGYLSDETVSITPDGVVHPPKPLSVITDPEQPGRERSSPRPTTWDSAHPDTGRLARFVVLRRGVPDPRGLVRLEPMRPCSTSSSSRRRSAEVTDPLVTLLSLDRRDGGVWALEYDEIDEHLDDLEALLAEDVAPVDRPQPLQHPGTHRSRRTGRGADTAPTAAVGGRDRARRRGPRPVGERAVRLDNLMATLWLELDSPRTLDALVGAAQSRHGEHPDAQDLVEKAVDRDGRSGARRPGERWHDRAVTSVALVLAPLTCAVVLLISGVAKVGRPAATREAFLSMGRAPGPPLRALVTSLPYVEIALGVLLLVTWSWPLAVVAARRRRCSRRTGCSCSGCCGGRGGRLRVLRSPGRRPGLGDDAGAQLPPGGARRPRDGLRSRRFRCAARRARLRDRGLVVARAHGRGGGDGGAGGRAAPARAGGRRRRPARLRARPDPLRHPGGRVRHPHHAAAAGRPATPAAGLPEHLLLGLRDGRGAAARLGVPSRPGRGLDGVHRAPGESSGDDAARRRPAWFDVEHGATDTFADGRPSAVLLGADGALAGGPVVGAGDVATFVEDIVAELRLGSRTCRCRSSPSTPPSARQDHDHGHDHTSDDGHGHA